MTPTLSHRIDHAIAIRKNIGTPEFTLRKMKTIQPHCYKTFQRFYKADVNIAIGTDMGFEPGMGSNAFELETYVWLGMTPMDAILIATRNAARALKKDKDLGTLEAGKLADIVAVDGDPLADIRIPQERKRIQLVMKEGDIYIDRRPWSLQGNRARRAGQLAQGERLKARRRRRLIGVKRRRALNHHS